MKYLQEQHSNCINLVKNMKYVLASTVLLINLNAIGNKGNGHAEKLQKRELRIQTEEGKRFCISGTTWHSPNNGVKYTIDPCGRFIHESATVRNSTLILIQHSITKMGLYSLKSGKLLNELTIITKDNDRGEEVIELRMRSAINNKIDGFRLVHQNGDIKKCIH